MTDATLSSAAAQPAAESPSAPELRGPRGRFAPGNPGGPGRPRRIARINREVVSIMIRAIPDQAWADMAFTAACQAAEGSHTARAWLTRTLLMGQLDEAAVAEAVGLAAEFEMVEQGRERHKSWLNWLAAGHEANRTPAEPVAAPAAETVQTVETASVAEPAQPAAETEPDAETEPSAPSHPTATPPAQGPRTVPPSERVFGFRVSKGVPREDRHGRKRSKTVKTAAATPVTPVAAAG